MLQKKKETDCADHQGDSSGDEPRFLDRLAYHELRGLTRWNGFAKTIDPWGGVDSLIDSWTETDICILRKRDCDDAAEDRLSSESKTVF